MHARFFRFVVGVFLLTTTQLVLAQGETALQWTPDGNGFYQLTAKGIVKTDIKTRVSTPLIDPLLLTPAGGPPILPVSFKYSNDNSRMIFFTNTAKVWRYNTRGDYWILHIPTKKLVQLGKGLPARSLMFAKMSPDGRNAAYVSQHNLFVEDLTTGKIRQLTVDGTRKIINGTFDWVYEEEFFCRDGFRWSPDSKKISYWQIDATNTKDYEMINTTDSIYPKVIPVEYPVAGESPSPFKIGVIDLATDRTKWMDIPTDKNLQSYVARMEWATNNDELIIQHLNRKQNQSTIMLCKVATGKTETLYKETDSAWIDTQALWDDDYANGGWDWLDNGNEFLWASEKDGWRHLYRLSRDGKRETLVTNGAYDVMDIVKVDEKGGFVYFMASPTNATQKYLYRTSLDGKGKAERLTPSNQTGMHDYKVSTGAKFALHAFSNHYTPESSEWISVADHKSVDGKDLINQTLATADKSSTGLEFIKVKTSEGVEMDAWIRKPQNFNPAKKYPVVFYVYTEPWGQNVKDEFGVGNNLLYLGDMAADGYLYVSIDNRGTPVPKGRAWRKSVYKKIGQVNINDQAMAAKEILKLPYVDATRVAVWGWSGGGSATLNLMFQYPEIYQTGIAVAAVANQLTYDNIYQERYMGLPQEDKESFIKGSPITYAKNLKGNLLYIHGTGDDNVHYNNAEQLVNELIKHNKQFQFMPYPNRTHGLVEGEGTRQHLMTLYTNYLQAHCPPGGR
ncbi:MAG: DPP IV N-terminal domain-containing protein [Ferruginibacter sp.]|nr:DPP IV N-terminal domain-containing protein [Ferruginibacter sp.]